MKRFLVPGIAALSFAASLAHAGGPLIPCNASGVKYPGAGAASFNFDLGPLGPRTKEQADALVAQALGIWNTVPTSTLTVARGPDMPYDVDLSNYLMAHTVGDGMSPIIYDTDGMLINGVFGALQSQFVFSIGSSAYAPGNCTFLEGQLILNGRVAITDAQFVTTVAREVGLLVGLDRTQLDQDEGVIPKDFPVMYPYSFREVQSLHGDDAAALSALYPGPTLNAVYGQVSGNLTHNGVPVLGANIWANEVNTGKLYSIVSDYLMQGDGYFRLLLPSGTYRLHAEPIDISFAGNAGMSVGPYAQSTATSASFKPPMYPTPSTPIAPVTLGNASPIAFRITPGCSAAAVFHLDGTGSVQGCPPPASTDLNGDGKSDLLYRNTVTGQVYRMLMDGFSITDAAVAYFEPDTNWYIAMEGDFNGDGVTDLVWRNMYDGRIYMQLYGSNGLPTGGSVFWIEPNPAWRLAAAPDMDGDGKADLVWYNALTRQAYAMRMDGTAILSAGAFYTEPDWRLTMVGAGDFSGNGKKNQLLWRNGSTGEVYLMTVAATLGIAPTRQLIYKEPDTHWQIAAVADFNGDGKSDILWRNFCSGQVYMMLMDGPTIAAAGQVYVEPNNDWVIASVGDYDGDGKADILWRHQSTGQVYMQQMNGLAIVNQGFVYTEPNLQWELMGPPRYVTRGGVSMGIPSPVPLPCRAQ